jgi:hypothetical protein
MLRSVSLCVASVLWACSGQNLDVGNDPPATGGTGGSIGGTGGLTGGTGGSIGGTGGLTGGTGGTSDDSNGGSPDTPDETEPLPPEALEPLPSQTDCATDPELAGIVGTWEGQLEDAFFRPIQRLRVVINGASSAGFCGTVTWGDKSAPPPAEDPSAVYPPAEYWSANPVIGFASAIEGFPYTIAASGQRLPSLKLGIVSTEPWQSFCGLQTPILDDSRWGCIEQTAARHFLVSTVDYSGYCDVQTPAGNHSYSQMQCQACDPGGICICDSAHCTIDKLSSALDFTLVDDGNAMTAPFIGWGPTSSLGWLDPDAGDPSAYYLERVED